MLAHVISKHRSTQVGVFWVRRSLAIQFPWEPKWQSAEHREGYPTARVKQNIYTHICIYVFFSVFLVALLTGDRMAIDRRKVLLMWLFSINLPLCPHSRHVPAPNLFKLMNFSYGIGVKEVTNASFNNGQVMGNFSKLDGIWGLTSISNRARQERHFTWRAPR